MKQQKWINISILLFIIFIIIPLILQMFGVKVIEGLQNIPEKDSTGQASKLSTKTDSGPMFVVYNAILRYSNPAFTSTTAQILTHSLVPK